MSALPKDPAKQYGMGFAAGERAGIDRGVQETIARLTAAIREQAAAAAADPHDEPEGPLFEAIEDATGFGFPGGSEFMAADLIAEGFARYVEQLFAPDDETKEQTR